MAHADRRVTLAIVHHANQYLISDGYENREGLNDLIGSNTSNRGYLAILNLHLEFEIPLHLQLSGTLAEAILWHRPDFLEAVRRLLDRGLARIIGSCYGQNIMPYFSPVHNRAQLNEGLRVLAHILGIEPRDVTVFWPPERVWDTASMAGVLTDPTLLNGGYRHVLVDDRVLFPITGSPSRHDFDQRDVMPGWEFMPWEIERGYGLTALPIARDLRYGVPPRAPESWQHISRTMDRLSQGGEIAENCVAIYADDMEKVAGVGPWDAGGPAGYRQFLEWIRGRPDIEAIRLDQWFSADKLAGRRPLDRGTYFELAESFGAGEGYDKWFLSPEWEPFRFYARWAEQRVLSLRSRGADQGLIELAWKQLLVSSYETAWHTPSYGPHGDESAAGAPSPWVRAVASHVRHAAVMAEAAYWMRHKDGRAHAYLADLDNDGELELVLKNDALFAVITPNWGARLIYLFSVEGDRGKLVIGNPCDDWNWMEELNKYMEVPPNHPGALADDGFVHDPYSVSILSSGGGEAAVRLENIRTESAARGLAKEISLRSESENSLSVSYLLPESLSEVCIEFGMSPDYQSLLSTGQKLVRILRASESRGCAAGPVAVWIRPAAGQRVDWPGPFRSFGHGYSISLTGHSREIRFSIEVIDSSSTNRIEALRAQPATRKTKRKEEVQEPVLVGATEATVRLNGGIA